MPKKYDFFFIQKLKKKSKVEKFFFFKGELKSTNKLLKLYDFCIFFADKKLSKLNNSVVTKLCLV